MAKAAARGAGPKGTRVGDLILAERSTWRVVAIVDDRRQAVAQLIRGAHSLRRFRARQIECVWPTGAEQLELSTPGGSGP